jgi:serralysin
MATDVNRWRGRFTGKNGVRVLDDLFSPMLQDMVMLELAQYNFGQLDGALRLAGCKLADRLKAVFKSSGCGTVTLSGLLAGAHLCGVRAVSGYLLDAQGAEDETGTSLEPYLLRFSGHAIEEYLGTQHGVS